MKTIKKYVDAKLHLTKPMPGSGHLLSHPAKK